MAKVIFKFRCVTENHNLWFYKREFTKNMAPYTKAWFICYDCGKQSMYFDPKQLSLKVSKLHDEHRPKLPYLEESDVETVIQPYVPKKRKKRYGSRA